MADSPATNEMSEAITRTLPFLRRYARAVTGSQKRGDEWVRLCAEVVMAQPDLITKAEDTKLGVFTLFHRLRQPFGNLEEGAGEDSVSGRLKESLTDMAPLQRQVLLLTVLEGFTVADAARILGIDADAAERSLEEARRELDVFLSRLDTDPTTLERKEERLFALRAAAHSSCSRVPRGEGPGASAGY